MTNHPKLTRRKKKERLGGCFLVADQKATIARKKAAGAASSPSAASIVSGILIKHGGLVAIMAVGQIMSALMSTALTAFVSLIVSFGRRAPMVFQGGAKPVRTAPVSAPRFEGNPGKPAPQMRAALRPSVGGGAEKASAPAPLPLKPALSTRPQDIAHRDALAAGRAIYGNERAFDVIAQKLEYKLEAPITGHVKELQRLFDTQCPALASFLSKETNSENSAGFKQARAIYKQFRTAHPNFSGEAAAHAIHGQIMEIALAAEAARKDPTKGPGTPGLENDGDGEGGSVKPRKSDDDYEPPAPTPFGRKG